MANKKTQGILTSLFNLVGNEAMGSAEHVCEYFNPKEVYEAAIEEGVDPSELEEMKGYLEKNGEWY